MWHLVGQNDTNRFTGAGRREEPVMKRRRRARVSSEASPRNSHSHRIYCINM